MIVTQTWISISFIVVLLSFTGNPPATHTFMDEICDNAIDDDDDGLIDLNDPDCICELVRPESIIPNPSFEDYTCCPKEDSQLNCAVGWDQASGATTDYLHTCGYLAAGAQMLPFPDGQGAALFLHGTVNNGSGSEIYKEYAGVCLNRPMKKDSIYKFKFHLGFLSKVSSPEIRFAFFGSPSCDNLPFSTLNDCPINYPDWYFLKAERVSSGEFPNWVEVTTEIKPSMDINALVIGGDCSGDSEGMLRIYFIDNLRLNDESNFDFDLIDQVSSCDSNFTFEVAENPIFSYQWYKDGIALIGETGAKMSKMYEEGTYQLRIVNRTTDQCRIADDFEFEIPILTNEVFESICEGESLMYEGDIIDKAGAYEYTLTSVEGCDSIVTLNVDMKLNETDTVYAQILPGSTFSIGESDFTDEGEHRINTITSNGCNSSTILFLDHINVFIPDAFSPNNDGINDYFEVFTSDDEFVMKEMSIFDRWGNLLYLGKKWDGKSGNKFMKPGVYVYLVKVIDTTGEELIFSNSLTLVR